MTTPASTTGLHLTLDPKDVERIITETIKTQVATALAAKGDGLVTSIIQTALSDRRDNYGHHSEREPTVLEKLLRKEIEAATKAAIHEWVTDNKAAFTKSVAACLKAANPKITSGLVDAFVAAISHQHLSVGLNVTVPKREY